MMRHYIASHNTECYLQDTTKIFVKKMMKRLKKSQDTYETQNNVT